MSGSTYRKIIVEGESVRKEKTCSVAVKPGHLLERVSDDTVKPHATTGGLAELLFAVENDLEGETIDDTYAISDIVQFNAVRPGDVVLVWIADGEDIAIGDKLASNGDGDFKEHGDSGDESAGFLLVALEAKDMSGSAGADPADRRIIAEVA